MEPFDFASACEAKSMLTKKNNVKFEGEVEHEELLDLISLFFNLPLVEF